MPILKHAKKKQKQDKRRTLENKKTKEAYKDLLKTAKLEKTAEAVSKAFSGLDKAAKNHIMHPNKAARLKSALTKLTAPAAEAPKEEKPAKTTKAANPAPKTKSKGTKSAKSSAK